MSVVGAIDIGSNAIRMVCARLTQDYRIEIIEKYRTQLRLGEDVFRLGYITEERIELLLEALKVYKRTLEQNECEKICAYCTSAFRETANQQEIIERVLMETGIRLETISGGEEAQLLQRAIQRVMELKSGRLMMADLGGGSLEVSVLQDGEIEFAESFRMGTVRMLMMFPYHPETEVEFLSWGRYFIEDFSHFLKTRLQNPRVDKLVITGGNATAIWRMKGVIDQKSSGPFEGNIMLEKSGFKKLKQKLLNHTLNERIEKLNMDVDRADVILPALLIFDQLLKLTDCSAFNIPAVGLRDGILEEMLERHKGAPNLTAREQVIHSARFYAGKYLSDLQHGETVRELALQLFDGMQALHNLKPRQRLLLEPACIRHDIGRFIRPSDHHKHSMYLIRNMELVGVTNSELMIIALVARYHSRGMPSDKHKEFSRLDSRDRSNVKLLTALLRVADALDREHNALAGNLELECTAAVVRLRLECVSGKTQDFMLARWAVQHKKQLFEQIFRRKLEVIFA